MLVLNFVYFKTILLLVYEIFMLNNSINFTSYFCIYLMYIARGNFRVFIIEIVLVANRRATTVPQQHVSMVGCQMVCETVSGGCWLRAFSVAIELCCLLKRKRTGKTRRGSNKIKN